MKLKLNMYQYNMAIYRVSAVEHELVPLNQLKVVKFSGN